jgi:hypothetical protein
MRALRRCARRGAYLELEPDATRTLDVFYRPYSYVSESLVRYEDERRAA